MSMEPVNLEQGAVIHSDYVVFDPLPEEAFGANVHLKLDGSFNLDPCAHRCIVVPFHVTDPDCVEIASAEKLKVELDLKKADYALYFEVCEGEEIYYIITLVLSGKKVTSKYLLDDPWGGEKDKVLIEELR